jgi:hypothetical protein
MELQEKNVRDLVAGMESMVKACNEITKALTKEAEPEEKPVTLEEVRGKLAELSKEGKTAEVRELIKTHGGTKLSDIEPGKYAALLAAAEELAHAK